MGRSLVHDRAGRGRIGDGSHVGLTGELWSLRHALWRPDRQSQAEEIIEAKTKRGLGMQDLFLSFFLFWPCATSATNTYYVLIVIILLVGRVLSRFDR